MTRDRAWLRKRYLSLGAGELTSAAIFPVTAYMIVRTGWQQEPARALWSALIPLLTVLVQAGFYWLLARRWVGIGTMPVPLARVYSGFRAANVLMLTVALVAVVAWWPSSGVQAAIVSFVWLFGLVEHINYFHVRLSYPPSRWLVMVRQWRTPQLVKDLRASG